MKVMIVEDEALIAMHLEVLVTQFGHEVCAVANSAEEAMAHAAAFRPDVALMDIRLARGSSGIEAARLLHAHYALRCIFLSGNLDEAHKTAVQSCDPVDFIGKPVVPAMLERALRRFETDVFVRPQR
jgi:DNA-binding NarL/FixJ family response regulator